MAVLGQRAAAAAPASHPAGLLVQGAQPGGCPGYIQDAEEPACGRWKRSTVLRVGLLGA